MSPSSAHTLGKDVNVTNIAGDYYDTSTRFITTNVNVVSGKTPLDRLLEQIAPGALHDSAERGPHAPKCHLETRKAVQQDIISWIRQGDQDDRPKRILWLSGPAGSGKTAIAGTIADECHKEGLLAGSFFLAFSSLNRRIKRPFIPTLTYALLQQNAIVNLKDAILSAVDNDPTVLQKHLDQQLEELILGPLRAVAGLSDQSNWPKVIIVDGVDECSIDDGSRTPKEEAHKEVLSVLAHAVLDISFPFRIIIASRPEPAISEFFETSSDLTECVFLDKKYDPDADIRLFLEAKLSVLRRKYNLAQDWVPEGAVNTLVDRASGQFVYITTALRCIEDTSHPPPEQLKQLLCHQRADNAQSPLSTLDALYASILAASPDPPLAAKWLVVFAGVRLHVSMKDRGSEESAPLAVAAYRKALVESYAGEMTFLLCGLSALIDLTDDGRGLKVKFHHKSLIDFLGDASRSGRLHVSNENAWHLVEDRYYNVLKNRGPQSANLGESDMHGFFRLFCGSFPSWINSRHSYEASDITWWLEHLSANYSKEEVCPAVKGIFITVDQKCTWNHHTSCKLWRKVILRHCKANSWARLPTSLDLLRDRVNKLKYGEEWEGYYSALHACFEPPA
ncbi:hypothetical protein FA13DRAFT_1812528 [Coprinellus micaceus]|uniref:NACHT domain-containing protein n=1 Tax=Coprinellus micaceus TaxID=71717 RepID=A0A4Y7TII6_COPMI|nr:hypothetical protein FA13DRAFT_1812528 [Coprinellus micaceus]